MFIFTNGFNYVIADSEDECLAIVAKHFGYRSNIQEYKDSYPNESWNIVPEDKSIIVKGEHKFPYEILSYSKKGWFLRH